MNILCIVGLLLLLAVIEYFWLDHFKLDANKHEIFLSCCREYLANNYPQSVVESQIDIINHEYKGNGLVIIDIEIHEKTGQIKHVEFELQTGDLDHGDIFVKKINDKQIKDYCIEIFQEL